MVERSGIRDRHRVAPNAFHLSGVLKGLLKQDKARTVERQHPRQQIETKGTAIVSHLGEVNDFKPLGADLSALFLEIGAAIIEGVSEFDEHVAASRKIAEFWGMAAL